MVFSHFYSRKKFLCAKKASVRRAENAAKAHFTLCHDHAEPVFFVFHGNVCRNQYNIINLILQPSSKNGLVSSKSRQNSMESSQCIKSEVKVRKRFADWDSFQPSIRYRIRPLTDVRLKRIVDTKHSKWNRGRAVAFAISTAHKKWVPSTIKDTRKQVVNQSFIFF